MTSKLVFAPVEVTLGDDNNVTFSQEGRDGALHVVVVSPQMVGFISDWLLDEISMKYQAEHGE